MLFESKGARGVLRRLRRCLRGSAGAAAGAAMVLAAVVLVGGRWWQAQPLGAVLFSRKHPPHFTIFA